MASYILRRCLLVVPVMLGVSLIVFFVMRALPGDVATAQLGDSATPQALTAFRAENHLDDSLPLQYGRWAGGLVRLDLGRSLTGTRTPVRSLIWERLPPTLELLAFALAFSLMISIPAGIVSAARSGTVLDYLARVVSLLGLAVPSFVLASLMIVLPAQWWGRIPPIRYTPLTVDPLANLDQFILPGLALGAALAGSVTRMLRSQLLEVLRQDYIRTARAKGMHGRTIVLRHALRNAFIPVVTIVGLQVGALLGGAVIIESIFVIPGLGRLMLDGITQRDYNTVQGIVLFMSGAYVVTNLLVDLSYLWLDPRVRLS